ncbi:MAG: hypothetical protein ACRD2L_18870, partial [Terriglobia bacterium]
VEEYGAENAALGFQVVGQPLFQGNVSRHGNLAFLPEGRERLNLTQVKDLSILGRDREDEE